MWKEGIGGDGKEEERGMAWSLCFQIGGYHRVQRREAGGEEAGGTLRVDGVKFDR